MIGVVSDPRFMDHDTGGYHPESPMRIQYLHTLFARPDSGIMLTEPVCSTIEDILLNHGRSYIDSIARTADSDAYTDLDPDTTCSRDSYIVSLLAAGSVVRLTEMALDHRISAGFACVRPPGHHSMLVAHGARGFCNINIEAVMVEYIRHTFGVRRIAIVDTDCHHGDGTQDIYWNDPDVLCISMHQDGRTLYPGTGYIEDFGGPNALGATINIPLPPHTSDEGFLFALDNVILPILDEFKPEIIINSAGQDNHYSDPITNMNFSAQGYALLNEKLAPHIAVLEGGDTSGGLIDHDQVDGVEGSLSRQAMISPATAGHPTWKLGTAAYSLTNAPRSASSRSPSTASVSTSSAG